MGRAANPRRITAIAAMLCIAAALALGACSSSGGGSSSKACPATVDATVTAHDSLRFTPDSLTAKPGAWVVKLVNSGSITHTFDIHGLSGDVEASGGKSACGTFTLTKGTWTFYCKVPGHESAGMKGTLTVS